MWLKKSSNTFFFTSRLLYDHFPGSFERIISVPSTSRTTVTLVFGFSTLLDSTVNREFNSEFFENITQLKASKIVVFPVLFGFSIQFSPS